MVVMVIENAPLKVRGELTKWLLETKPGVFVGNVSALVRDKLWEKVCEDTLMLSALLIYSSNNEQGFEIEMLGEPYRSVVDFDGVKLIKTQVE